MAKLFKFKRFVKIMGVRLKIKYVKELLHDGDEELAGAYNHDTHTIFISKAMDRGSLHSTLCHEVLHGALAISGAGTLLSEKDEEVIVSALEVALRDYLFF